MDRANNFVARSVEMFNEPVHVLAIESGNLSIISKKFKFKVK